MTLLLSELQEGLPHIGASPKAAGTVMLIVCRPEINQRQVLAEGNLSCEAGLAGDSWLTRGGTVNPDMQLNLMNSRAIELIAETQERWPLAGDQLYVDLNLGAENLPPGTQLQVGSATIQVTAEPHLGCRKFAKRFGRDAVKFVNSSAGKVLNLRGINARVIRPGVVRPGDSIVKKK